MQSWDIHRLEITGTHDRQSIEREPCAVQRAVRRTALLYTGVGRLARTFLLRPPNQDSEYDDGQYASNHADQYHVVDEQCHIWPIIEMQNVHPC